jgi:DNA helicase-2/ATP-dependent DNA helicase PcrA
VREYLLDPAPPGRRRPGFLDDLNAEQRRAVEHGAGPMLVLAGAGTGKTRTLVYRAAHLIDGGLDPTRLMMLTFTNRAAREMTERISGLVPAGASEVWIGTFHRIGARILRRHAERLGYASGFGILGREDAKDLAGSVLAEVVQTVDGRRFPKAEVLLSLLSAALNTDRPLQQVLATQAPQFLSHLARIDQVLTAYLQRKVELNLMDYDDLLVNWRLLLTDHEDLRALYREQFEHVLVDEYQDTNRLQAALVELIGGGKRNVMVVGDDCQAIYSFRGATVENILRFPEEWSGCETFRLETNYRSVPEILEVANRAIRHNRRQFQKTLRSPKEPSGERPAWCVLPDDELQARFVAQRVLELRDTGTDVARMVVLYRAHHHALELQLELQRRGIPFTVRSGLRFFEQAHIRDLLAHLKVVFNPWDQLSWVRVLKLREGLGPRHAHTVWTELQASGDPWGALVSGVIGQGLPKRARQSFETARALLLDLAKPALRHAPAEVFERLLAEGYEAWLRASYENASQRIEDVRQLAHFAAGFDDVSAFLEELQLVDGLAAQDVEKGGSPDEHLVLSTVHQAKGLEWDVVFVLGLADGQFPMAMALKSEADEEEERRLFYVAVTRARKQLYLCQPTWGRDRERMRVMMRPSRFLAEVAAPGDGLLEVWRIGEKR